MKNQANESMHVFPSITQDLQNGLGYPAITKERDACGVGLVVHKLNKPSHTLVMQALEALSCMEHRGGCSADRDSGDGAGITSGIPWKLFKNYFAKLNINLRTEDLTGVGMLFLPPDSVEESKKIVEWIINEEGFKLVGWRKVPVVEEILGREARLNKPVIEQVFIQLSSTQIEQDVFERRLYLLRKKIEKMV